MDEFMKIAIHFVLLSRKATELHKSIFIDKFSILKQKSLLQL